MVSRTFYRKQSNHREIKEVFCKVTIGASGAPTLVSGEYSQGVSSISRTSEGLYRITLADSYAAFICGHVAVLSSTSQGIGYQFKAEDVDGSTPYVDVEFSEFDYYSSQVEDPASGSILYIKLELKAVPVRS